MKLRNLLGVISCLLIAFSGTSYSQSFGPSFSPPPPTNLIINPKIPSTGGSVPSGITGTVNTGVNEDDDEKCDLRCARDKGRDEGTALVRKIIENILTQEKVENTFRFGAFGHFFNYSLPHDVNGLGDNILGLVLAGERFFKGGAPIFPSENTKLNKARVAAQRIEFSLRRVETRYTKAADKPDCDEVCGAYNLAKANAVGQFHGHFNKALAYAKIDLLQSRIPK